MAKLTYKQRKSLPSSAFVFPKERKYPIIDKSHGRSALQRASQFGSPSVKAKVRAKVKKKFPGIKQNPLKMKGVPLSKFKPSRRK